MPINETKRKHEVQTVTLIEAADIVVTKKPRGLFIAKADNIPEWVAVRNTGLRIESETFDTQDQCLQWLKE